MPITRRKRANPPDQPENNNHLADQSEHAAEALAAEQPSEATTRVEVEETPNPVHPVPPIPPAPTRTENIPYPPIVPSPPPAVNGDRTGRVDYPPSIESGRRTARGELFRRPPQPPIAASAMSPTPAGQMPVPAPLQAPSHEIKLPLGARPGDTAGDPLHLAYNPGYTGADEVRSGLLHKLTNESKSGGRGRCWSCGSLAIAYDCWNTRNKTFGEIGIAFCEICGVWSVM